VSSEPLHIFDPHRNLQLQGFSGRAATSTNHDATETDISISGIFQAAEDFAALGWWNACDYFNHVRLKHLPKTDLSGLRRESWIASSWLMAARSVARQARHGRWMTPPNRPAGGASSGGSHPPARHRQVG
jgi:hypothetical protein